jgi:ABC-type polysaccharide transport system permease subunit
MKKKNYSEMTLEELQKTKKTLVFAAGVLSGMLIASLLITLLTLKEGMSPLLVIPLALSPILFMNYNLVKTINKELKARIN